MAQFGLILFMGIITMTFNAVFSRGISSHCPAKCACNESIVKCVDKRLSVIPDFKKVNRSLTIIDLSQNDIEEVKTTNFLSIKLITLEYLHLNDNSIMEIEVLAFSKLQNLQYLDLSNNLLEYIPNHVIQRNKHLKEINLSGNLFTSNAPELISDSLQILDLSFSKVSVFTENNLKDLTNLRVLYLHGNNLKQMDYNMFETVKLHYVDLSFNCWNCNCDTIKLFKYLVKGNLTEIDRPIQCMHKNKWYEDIYNSNGPMHNNKLCKKIITYSNHEEDDSTIYIPKKNFTSIEIDDVSNKKQETPLESEEFSVRIEIIIIGIITIVLTLVSVIVIKIVITKSKSTTKYNIYEELSENGLVISKIPNKNHIQVLLQQ